MNRKPCGFVIVYQRVTESTADSQSITGTPHRYFSWRQAIKGARRWMARGPSFQFTVEPIWGPVA